MCVCGWLWVGARVRVLRVRARARTATECKARSLECRQYHSEIEKAGLSKGQLHDSPATYAASNRLALTAMAENPSMPSAMHHAHSPRPDRVSPGSSQNPPAKSCPSPQPRFLRSIKKKSLCDQNVKQRRKKNNSGSQQVRSSALSC